MNITASGALFSACGCFRWLLWRCWDSSLPTLGLCGLNPSTAGADSEDPSSRRFRGFASRLGFGSYITGNLYGWVATDPSDLKAAGYPVGDENDLHLEAIARGAAVFVCCWGRQACGLARPQEVRMLLCRLSVMPMALAINADGTPQHPLRLAYNDAEGRPRRLLPWR